jgi:hypothetical protein
MTLRRSFLQRAEKERSLSLASQAEAWPLQIAIKAARDGPRALQRLGIGAHRDESGVAYERPQVQRADLSYRGGTVETVL